MEQQKSKLDKSNSENIAMNGTENTTINNKTKDGLFHISELNRRMQEMIGQYMLLEEYYMIESVKKVI